MHYMTDAQGRQVPDELVKDIDKLRNDVVLAVIEKARAARAVLERFQSEVSGEIDAFLALSAERYHKTYGGKKGNITLTSYDGRYRVVIAVNEHIAFDERLQVAKRIIDECITRWSEGSRRELCALVNDAFAVDRAGKLNYGRILGLRRLEIADARWQEAMRAIGDSVQVTGSKTYLRVYEREHPDGAYRQIALDLAAL